MNATQTELLFRAQAQRDEYGAVSLATGAEVGLLMNILRDAGWLKAEAIRADSRFVAHYGEACAKNVEKAERKIRAVANQSGGQVLSYPGSPGYKLTLQATPEDMKGAEVLRSQAAAMEARYLRLERVWHGRVGA